jgi:hypothetical protein
MSVPLAHRILFNFAASPVGGGLKRLYEYAKWFDANGGARFIIHPACSDLPREFPHNDFVIARQSSASRVLRGVRSVEEIVGIHGAPDCYFAYGIPLAGRIGRINWFHLSNVLPLAWRTVPLPVGMRMRFAILGRQIGKGLQYADVISAESTSSLMLFDAVYRDRLFQSLNGNDDELAAANAGASQEERHEIAVVVGTYPYKALDESCRVFDELRKTNDQLKLLVFGDAAGVPPAMRDRSDVVIKGNRARSEVMTELRRARYYISTTLIENSSNAATEGLFFAEQSYVSDIGPHRELLAGLPHRRVVLAPAIRPLLHARRCELSVENLKTWAQVITEMNQRIDRALSAVQSSAGSSRAHV